MADKTDFLHNNRSRDKELLAVGRWPKSGNLGKLAILLKTADQLDFFGIREVFLVERVERGFTERVLRISLAKGLEGAARHESGGIGFEDHGFGVPVHRRRQGFPCILPACLAEAQNTPRPTLGLAVHDLILSLDQQSCRAGQDRHHAAENRADELCSQTHCAPPGGQTRADAHSEARIGRLASYARFTYTVFTSV